jgi:hypothetical protein
VKRQLAPSTLDREARQGKTIQGKARQYTARQDNTMQGKTRQDNHKTIQPQDKTIQPQDKDNHKTRHDKTIQGKTLSGKKVTLNAGQDKQDTTRQGVKKIKKINLSCGVFSHQSPWSCVLSLSSSQ